MVSCPQFQLTPTTPRARHPGLNQGRRFQLFSNEVGPVVLLLRNMPLLFRPRQLQYQLRRSGLRDHWRRSPSFAHHPQPYLKRAESLFLLLRRNSSITSEFLQRSCRLTHGSALCHLRSDKSSIYSRDRSLGRKLPTAISAVFFSRCQTALELLGAFSCIRLCTGFNACCS